MALPATPIANLIAGWSMVLVAVALLLRSRTRAARLLLLYLALRGLWGVIVPLNWFVSDPTGQALVNTGFIPFYWAFVPLVLFGSEITGRHRRFWRHPAALAGLMLIPASLTLLELALSDPLWERVNPGVLVRGPYGDWFSFWVLASTTAFVYVVVLLARALRSETDPAEIPVRALLLAAFVVPAVHLVRNALLQPGPWRFLELFGASVPPLLPATPWTRLVLAVALPLLIIPLVRKAASRRTQEAAGSAIALSILISIFMALVTFDPLRRDATVAEIRGMESLRWVFLSLLVAYAALRHGLLGARRLASPVVEVAMAAVAFGTLSVLFTAALTLWFPDWVAVTVGMASALLAAALTVSLSGTQLGPGWETRYQAERELGRGAQGRAVLALDRRLHRSVVLKQIAAGDAALREARAAARVQHPSLVTIHDVIEEADGAQLVLEYLPGGTLADRLETGPVAHTAAQRIALELSEALETLHAAGMVHGDVKASNVFFRPDGRAVLGDFGTARSRPDVERTMEALSTMPLAGSLAGVAPEVLRNKRPGVQADVYGLAALLYRCLTGQSYVEMPPTYEDARDAILHAPPRLPHPDVPERWEALLARALDKEPNARPRSVADFQNAFRGSPG